MRPRTVVGCAVTLYVLASVTLLVAQEVSGVEHWVEHAGLKLYVWEKYLGSPAGKPVVVLAHGSATAGRESFDLQVPGKPSYSLMDVLAREDFDVFAPDIRGFGRSHGATPRVMTHRTSPASRQVDRRERHAGTLARAVLRRGGDGDTAS